MRSTFRCRKALSKFCTSIPRMAGCILVSRCCGRHWPPRKTAGQGCVTIAETRRGTELKANSLSLFESIVMGVAGSAPGYTIAVTTAVLLGVGKALSPGALLTFAIPMLGIAVAYKALNREHVHAGAAYQWTTVYFGKLAGFFSGWAVLVASMVFMVAGSLPLATATLDFVDPALASHVALSAGVA